MAVWSERASRISALPYDLTGLDLVPNLDGLRAHVAVHRTGAAPVFDGDVDASPGASVVGYDGAVLHGIEGRARRATEVLAGVVAGPGPCGTPWRSEGVCSFGEG